MQAYQFLLEFRIQIISVFGKIEFEIIVMWNLCSIFSCISILKSFKSKLEKPTKNFFVRPCFSFFFTS